MMNLRTKTLSLLATLLLLTSPASAAEASSAAAKIRIACIGASITYGAGLENRETNCYPAKLQSLLGEAYEVRNFGVNSRTLLKHGDFPYWNDDAYQQALRFAPNIVVVDLGGNDSKPQNWKHKNEFVNDARAMIESFRALATKPRVLICLPTPAFQERWGINDRVITQEVIPLLRQVAFQTGTETIDLHTAFLGRSNLVFDCIHPNIEGAAYLAGVIRGVVCFQSDPGFNLEKILTTQGNALKVSSFHGYRQLEFDLSNGRHCTVVRPYLTAAGRPYAWRGEFFGHEPQTDLSLLQRGFHVVYVDAQNLYGAPPAMAIWEQCYETLTHAGLSGKITLIGMSRGGLYCYNWAARHPETVSVIYGDAPLCDIKNWPRNQPQYASGWTELLAAYGFKTDAEAIAYHHNPVDNLAPLANAGIAIIHVIGEADDVVSVERNSDVIERRYRELGGTIQVIRKPGIGHHPHSLPNPEPIVDFILQHQ